MTYLSISSNPLHSVFFTRTTTLKQWLMITVGVLLLVFSAQLSIPLEPVPLTFQSATVILIGLSYGPRYGCYVICAYLLAGFAGLPIFANFSGGLPALFGPRAGYLLGFLPAVFLSGYLAQHGFAKSRISSFIAACLGSACIFLSGVTVLSTFIGWHQAILLGVMPFVVSELIKLAAVAAIAPICWKKS